MTDTVLTITNTPQDQPETTSLSQAKPASRPETPEAWVDMAVNLFEMCKEMRQVNVAHKCLELMGKHYGYFKPSTPAGDALRESVAEKLADLIALQDALKAEKGDVPPRAMRLRSVVKQTPAAKFTREEWYDEMVYVYDTSILQGKVNTAFKALESIGHHHGYVDCPSRLTPREKSYYMGQAERVLMQSAFVDVVALEAKIDRVREPNTPQSPVQEAAKSNQTMLEHTFNTLIAMETKLSINPQLTPPLVMPKAPQELFRAILTKMSTVWSAIEAAKSNKTQTQTGPPP